MQVEDEILAAGAELIWVLEANSFGQPGTAADCRNLMNNLGSSQGWCVGDGATLPMAGVWDNSPFSLARGFDIIVPRETMVVEFSTSHGTTQGNENISGQELLEQIQLIAEGL